MKSSLPTWLNMNIFIISAYETQSVSFKAHGARICDPNTIIKNLIDEIVNEKGSGTAICRGNTLDPSMTLEDAGIRNNDVLLLSPFEEIIFGSPAETSGSRDWAFRGVGIQGWPRALYKSFAEAMNGLRENIPPHMAADGTGGTYFLPSVNGNYVGCFKPFDEENNCPANPKGRTGDEPGLSRIGLPVFDKEGLLTGEGYVREAAAYVLDAMEPWNNLSSIPPTGLIEGWHPALSNVVHTDAHSLNSQEMLDQLSFQESPQSPHDPSISDATKQPKMYAINATPTSTVGGTNGLPLMTAKLGSFQVFLPNVSSIADENCTLIPDFEAQKLALLDLRLLNHDRNEDNVMIRRRKIPVRFAELLTVEGALKASQEELDAFRRYELDLPQTYDNPEYQLEPLVETMLVYPIDHGLCFPSNVNQWANDWDWRFWKQIKKRLHPLLVKALRDTNIDLSINVLRSLFGKRFRHGCLTTLRIMHMILRTALLGPALDGDPLNGALTIFETVYFVARTKTMTTKSVLEKCIHMAQFGARFVHVPPQLPHLHRPNMRRINTTLNYPLSAQAVDIPAGKKFLAPLVTSPESPSLSNRGFALDLSTKTTVAAATSTTANAIPFNATSSVAMVGHTAAAHVPTSGPGALPVGSPLETVLTDSTPAPLPIAPHALLHAQHHNHHHHQHHLHVGHPVQPESSLSSAYSSPQYSTTSATGFQHHPPTLDTPISHASATPPTFNPASASCTVIPFAELPRLPLETVVRVAAVNACRSASAIPSRQRGRMPVISGRIAAELIGLDPDLPLFGRDAETDKGTLSISIAVSVFSDVLLGDLRPKHAPVKATPRLEGVGSNGADLSSMTPEDRQKLDTYLHFLDTVCPVPKTSNTTTVATSTARTTTTPSVSHLPTDPFSATTPTTTRIPPSQIELLRVEKLARAFNLRPGDTIASIAVAVLYDGQHLSTACGTPVGKDVVFIEAKEVLASLQVVFSSSLTSLVLAATTQRESSPIELGPLSGKLPRTTYFPDYLSYPNVTASSTHHILLSLLDRLGPQSSVIGGVPLDLLQVPSDVPTAECADSGIDKEKPSLHLADSVSKLHISTVSVQNTTCADADHATCHPCEPDMIPSPASTIDTMSSPSELTTPYSTAAAPDAVSTLDAIDTSDTINAGDESDSPHPRRVQPLRLLRIATVRAMHSETQSMEPSSPTTPGGSSTAPVIIPSPYLRRSTSFGDAKYGFAQSENSPLASNKAFSFAQRTQSYPVASTRSPLAADSSNATVQSPSGTANTPSRAFSNVINNSACSLESLDVTSPHPTSSPSLESNFNNPFALLRAKARERQMCIRHSVVHPVSASSTATASPNTSALLPPIRVSVVASEPQYLPTVLARAMLKQRSGEKHVFSRTCVAALSKADQLVTPIVATEKGIELALLRLNTEEHHHAVYTLAIQFAHNLGLFVGTTALRDVRNREPVLSRSMRSRGTSVGIGEDLHDIEQLGVEEVDDVVVEEEEDEEEVLPDGFTVAKYWRIGITVRETQKDSWKREALYVELQDNTPPDQAQTMHALATHLSSKIHSLSQPDLLSSAQASSFFVPGSSKMTTSSPLVSQASLNLSTFSTPENASQDTWPRDAQQPVPSPQPQLASRSTSDPEPDVYSGLSHSDASIETEGSQSSRQSNNPFNIESDFDEETNLERLSRPLAPLDSLPIPTTASSPEHSLPNTSSPAFASSNASFSSQELNRPKLSKLRIPTPTLRRVGSFQDDDSTPISAPLSMVSVSGADSSSDVFKNQEKPLLLRSSNNILYPNSAYRRLGITPPSRTNTFEPSLVSEDRVPQLPHRALHFPRTGLEKSMSFREEYWGPKSHFASRHDKNSTMKAGKLSGSSTTTNIERVMSIPNAEDMQQDANAGNASDTFTPASVTSDHADADLYPPLKGEVALVLDQLNKLVEDRVRVTKAKRTEKRVVWIRGRQVELP